MEPLGVTLRGCWYSPCSALVQPPLGELGQTKKTTTPTMTTTEPPTSELSRLRVCRAAFGCASPPSGVQSRLRVRRAAFGCAEPPLGAQSCLVHLCAAYPFSCLAIDAWHPLWEAHCAKRYAFRCFRVSFFSLLMRSSRELSATLLIPRRHMFMKVIVDRLFQRFQERIHGRDSAPRGSGPAETILEGPGAVLVKPLGVTLSCSCEAFRGCVFFFDLSLCFSCFRSWRFAFCFFRFRVLL